VTSGAECNEVFQKIGLSALLALQLRAMVDVCLFAADVSIAHLAAMSRRS
jgi:hypothetical protein